MIARFLTLLPTLEIVLAQIYHQTKIAVGGISLPQAFHGFAMIAVAGWLAAPRPNGRQPKRVQGLLQAMVGIAIALAIAPATRAAVGADAQRSAEAVIQWIYAVVLCVAYSRIVVTARGCKQVINAFAVAGLYAAISVGVGALLGVGRVYEDGVVSSAGGLTTAKGLTGIMFCALAARQLQAAGGRKEPRWHAWLFYAACIAGILLTQQRAAHVGMALAAMAWMAVNLFRRPVSALSRGAAATAIGVAVAVTIPTVFSIFDRWLEVVDGGEKMGSGRTLIWQRALLIYDNYDGVSRLVGGGADSLFEGMSRVHLRAAHTHSDILDILLIGGWLGLLTWAWFFIQFARVCLATATRGIHPEAAAIPLAVLSFFVALSIFTGQFFAPATITAYVTMTLVCARVQGCG